jgi:outer membrane protein OmpA-like peptidoglycan-associated protein
MRVPLLAMTIGIVLTGCAALPGEKSASADAHLMTVSSADTAVAVPVKDAQEFGYELLRREDTQLAEVFDDTHTTYLVFDREVPAGLLLFDERGRAVPFTVKERTAVVDVVRLGLLVRTPTKSSYAQAPKGAVVARLGTSGASEDASTPRLPVDVAAARAEILYAQDRLRGLSLQLDRASRGEPSAPLSSLRTEIEEIQTTLDGVDATVVRAHFATGSAILTLSAEAKRALVEAAGRAEQIRIRGGVDNAGSAAANDLLARRRALSMRQVLITGGVPASKVHLDPASHDYIASNDTAAGRAENRRVDVVFSGNGARQIPVAENRFSEPGSEATTR